MSHMRDDVRDALYDGCIRAWNIWVTTDDGKRFLAEFDDDTTDDVDSRLSHFISDVWAVGEKYLARVPAAEAAFAINEALESK